jgi:hypothetical protein|tara:strand:+ start:251 stop:427 length:177 start_codon:yes stop_codon:yes gene_type:complete
MKKLKAKLLTYLFTDWVKTEKDVETLLLTRDMITKRKDEIVGHTPILGFRMHTNNEIK